MENVTFAIETTSKLLTASSLLQNEALLERSDWIEKEFREGYMEGFVEQNIAWQIHFNRTKRNLTQSQLAAKINTRQSVISRAENLQYGKHSLRLLLDLANAFDCALSVKFISYAELARQSKSISEDDLIAESYEEDMKILGKL